MDRIVYEHEHAGRIVYVQWDQKKSQYRCRLVRGGAKAEEVDHFTDDLDEARRTAATIARRHPAPC